jgi:transcriptional regulator NrdR family protein
MNSITQLHCPSCGNTYTKATSTTTARSGDVRRHRKCTACAKGFVTYEVTAADYALLQSFRKWLKTEVSL